jgi:hypothetical protein
LKKTILILALVLFLKPTLPVIEYVANYDYISKVLCVNKDKPKMHCNGKCHLMKELAKTSEQEKPISSDKKITALEKEVLFFQEIKSVEIKPFYQNNTAITDNYSNLYFHLSSFSVFHPPIFT